MNQPGLVKCANINWIIHYNYNYNYNYIIIIIIIHDHIKRHQLERKIVLKCY